jgi:hypothetical protein
VFTLVITGDLDNPAILDMGKETAVLSAEKAEETVFFCFSHFFSLLMFVEYLEESEGRDLQSVPAGESYAIGSGKRLQAIFKEIFTPPLPTRARPALDIHVFAGIRASMPGRGRGKLSLLAGQW